MAAWFTIYCTRSLDHVTPDGIRAAIDAADLRTLAESLGMEDEEVVAGAPTRLRIEPGDGAGGVRCRLRYRDSLPRPLEVHVWTGDAEIDEMREEELERLDETDGEGLARIRSHLGRTVAVGAVQLGWSQLEDMGIVLAGVIAEHLAAVGDGLIRDPKDHWWAIEEGVPVLIAGPGDET
jgi:hypothetical protein